MKSLASADGTTANAKASHGLNWEGRPSVPLGRELVEVLGDLHPESTVTLRLGRDCGSESWNLPEPMATEVDVVLWNLYCVSIPVHGPPVFSSIHSSMGKELHFKNECTKY